MKHSIQITMMNTATRAVAQKRALRPAVAALLIVMLAATAGCQKAYYGAMEMVGVQKRQILVNRSEDSRNALHAAMIDFGPVLDRFSSRLQLTGQPPKERYEAVQALFDVVDSRAQTLNKSLDKTQDVADALFADWEKEARGYASEALQETARQRLNETRDAFRAMMRAARRAEDTVPPVLEPLRRHTLHLKINQNDQAAATVDAELPRLQQDIAALQQYMQTAIDEANRFIHFMNRSGQ